MADYDVFISAKSEDFPHAERVYEFLTGSGLRVFFSKVSVSQSGSTDYQKVIDAALESAEHLVVVGSRLENFTSSYVETEWRLFVGEKRAGRKTGNIVTVAVGGLSMDRLPLSLRNYEVIPLNEPGLKKLLDFVKPISSEVPLSRGSSMSALSHYRYRTIPVAIAAVLALAVALLMMSIIREGRGTRSHGSAVEPPLLPSGMDFIHIPAGEFTMGSNVPGQKLVFDERPPHRVYLKGFWIGKHEVTNRQFAEFVNSSSYPGAERWRNRYSLGTGREQYPVSCISWDDAVAYCRWMGGRLPTEAEWEKAARGPDSRVYPWGNDWNRVYSRPKCTLLNFADHNTRFAWSDSRADDGFDDTAPVGSFPDGASFYGVMDMAGNVQEWCADWFEDGYYRMSPSKNPKGPQTGDHRVVRGGSYNSGPGGVTCSARGIFDDCEVWDTGFRVVIDGSGTQGTKGGQ